MPPTIPILPAPVGPGVVNGTSDDDLIILGYSDTGGDLHGNTGSVIDAGEGDDNIYGGSGADLIWGGDGNDSLTACTPGAGTTAGSTLVGGAGTDRLVAGPGADLLIGGDPNDPTAIGNDLYYQLSGNDTAIGGAGSDYFALHRSTLFIDKDLGPITLNDPPDAGNIVIIGGEGDLDYPYIDHDTIHMLHDTDRGAASVVYTGAEQGSVAFENDTSIEFSEIEHLYLTSYDDQVTVEHSVNGLIYAGAGHDTLILPDPLPGEAAPVVVITETNFLGAIGYVIFADGNRLNFRDFEEILCFAAGTLIDTDTGPKPVETLRAGDRVLTRDAGYQPLVWTGSRALSAAKLARHPEAAPIRIQAGALGPGVPAQDLTVSPRHRMLIEGISADLLFGTRAVLVAAADLLALPGVHRVTGKAVVYVHVMCEAHQILRAQGAWSESFHASAPVLDTLDAATRAELLALFPALSQNPQIAARPVLTGGEARGLLALGAP